MTILIVSMGWAQEKPGLDLLEKLDASSATVSGTWTLTNGELQVEAARASRITVRDKMPLDYTMKLAFTRMDGDNSVCVILPIGNVSPALELSAWQGEAHGLSRVNELSSRDDANPTATKPGTLENGKRYLLEVAVRGASNPASLSAKLDGKPLFSWSGSTTDLLPNFAINLPTTRTLGLASQNNAVTFHSLTLLDDSTSSPAPPPVTQPTDPDSINLSGLGKPRAPGWDSFNGAAFTTSVEDGRTIVSSQTGAGSGDRGAYLEDVTFSDGTIEVELRGSGQPQSSFLGVVFHGEDGETYDSVYFRPFNFGNPDPVRRGHAVQYMSHPDFPWRKLRTERPEEFENPAAPEPKPNEWFRAKIEVKEGRIRAFVNGSDQPCLDVEKLSAKQSGKVGLWFNGVASFRNLKIVDE